MYERNKTKETNEMKANNVIKKRQEKEINKTKEINEEKRDQIITAALKEFAAKGYEQASTNAISKNAGVSKGLLFHYFGSKKGLYLKIMDYCIKRYLAPFEQTMNNLSKDIITKLYQISEMKLQLFVEEPLVNDIIIDAFVGVPQELEEEIRQRQNQIYQIYMPQIFQDIDCSLFKEGVDPQKAIALIMMITDAMSDRYIKAYKQTHDKNVIDLKAFREELKTYLEMLKTGIYSTTNCH